MTKTEAEKIAREILEHNGMGSNCEGPLVDYITSRLIAVFEYGKLAASPKWPEPSDEDVERATSSMNCYTLESMRGFRLGVSWAVERMRNE